MTYSHRIAVLLLLGLGSCRLVFRPGPPETRMLRVESAAADTLSEAEVLLRPYRDSLTLRMGEVLGRGEGEWVRERPAGSLGHLVADAMLERARMIDSGTVNAVCNYGGIRLPRWPAGPLTMGQVFELLPFDNELVLLELRGSELRQWIRHMARSGGWPLARPLPFDTLRLMALQPYTDTLPSARAAGSSLPRVVSFPAIADSARYLVATNDYVANGGDRCDFLSACPRRATGWLIRDVVADYIRRHSPLQPDPHVRIRIR